ncbi:MAG: hypothetical protein ABWZ53_07960 [Actinomycetota bacterium]
MRTARAWGRSLATVAVLTLVLTGCLKLDMALTVSPDDTVDGQIVFAVNKELLELTGQSVDDLLGDTTVPSDVEGATQEPYEDNTFVGTRVTFDSVPLERLQERSDPGSLSIERVGDRFEVSGVLDLGTQEADLQGNPFEDQITEAFDTAELKIAVTFPGEIIETNGRVAGTTVTWEPAIGERTELTAVASATGDGAAAEGDEGGGDAGTEAAAGETSGGTLWLWVLVALVVIAAMIGLFVVMRRRGEAGSVPAVGDAGTTPIPSVDVGTAPIPPAPVPPSSPAGDVTPPGDADDDDPTPGGPAPA